MKRDQQTQTAMGFTANELKALHAAVKTELERVGGEWDTAREFGTLDTAEYWANLHDCLSVLERRFQASRTRIERKALRERGGAGKRSYRPDPK